MLADTDVGSVITAGQSGVQWGYRLLLLQLMLDADPLHGPGADGALGDLHPARPRRADPRRRSGRSGSGSPPSGLGIACIGALLTEFSGVAGVGELYGLPRYASLPIAGVALLVGGRHGLLPARGASGDRRGPVRAGILLGRVRELTLQVRGIARGRVRDAAPRTRTICILAAANIGAVVMPWMVFYQQSAVADKRLRLRASERSAMGYGARRSDDPARHGSGAGGLRRDDLEVGSAESASLANGRRNGTGANAVHRDGNGQLNMHPTKTKIVLMFRLGVLGAGMVAAIVVSLASAWGLGEVAGYRRSLELHPMEAHWFYAVYAFARGRWRAGRGGVAGSRAR